MSQTTAEYGAPTIQVVAAFTTDDAGRMLLVRKQGSQIFMQPGGKPEPGETLTEALVRELSEELQVDVDPATLARWGRFEADAANEPGHRLVADVFGLRLGPELAAVVTASAEIAEAAWMTREQADALGDRLAPLARQMLAESVSREAFRPFRFVEPLVTDRLVLRPMTLADVDAVWSYQSREDVCAMLLFEPRTRARVTELVRAHAEALSLAGDGDYLQIAVARREDGVMLGDIYLAIKSVENLTAEIGWTFHPDHHGRGYATEAARAVLGLVFGRLGVHRVIAEYDPRNAASIAVAERLGMRPEALFRQDLWFKGEWADTGIHAILASEYGAQSGA